MNNQDFELCADGGLSDKVREITAEVSFDAIEQYLRLCDTYIKTGVTSAIPFMWFAIWVEIGAHDRKYRKHAAEVVRDTLQSILNEDFRRVDFDPRTMRL